MTVNTGYSELVARERQEVPVTIRNALNRRWVAATLITVIAAVTFAVPAWCVASGTWSW